MNTKKGKPSTEAPYDQIASWYVEQVRSNVFIDKMLIPHLFALLGNIEHQHICDLACGEGRISRQLATRSASIVGIDISWRLLQIAKQEENKKPMGITYLQDNAETLTTLQKETFDGMICHLALMDISDLKATFLSVWRALRPNGRFVFSLTHPCFQTPDSQWVPAVDGSVRRTVASYFNEGFWRSENAEGVRGQVGAHHRMLSTYLNDLVQAGFVLERIVEPQATGDVAVRIPGYAFVPAFIVIRARKERGADQEPALEQ